jgi:hypothetical protein
LNVGAGLEGSKSSFSKLGTSLQESFILAYELTRLRIKRDGSLKYQEKFVKHALYDDRKQQGEKVEIEALEKDWETEVVTLGTVHAD